MAKDDVSPSTSPSWRSSKGLLLFTATLGLFTENFLYGFVVPVLPYMIETRLGLDPASTQRYTTQLLFIMGLISVPAAPIIGHLADQTASRKIPLLISLLGCTIGTFLVAFTPSIGLVFLGRILQGVSGTGAWIVGFAMVIDAAGKESKGKALGLAGSFITAGIITGPTVAGILLQWLGYWPAWSVPMALLVICFAARLLMIEEPRKPSKSSYQESSSDEAAEPQNQNEFSPLLTSSEPSDPDLKSPTAKEFTKNNTYTFYLTMLSQAPVWAALFNVTAFSLLVSGFDATLPLHLRNTFGWGPAPIGSIFLGLQVPAIFLGPVVGLIRDRIGLRWPTMLGWLGCAPLLWFCGIPGREDGWLGIGSGEKGQVAFVGCVVGIGVVLCFARGAGTFQLITTLHDLQAKDPHIFGPGGGSSRVFSLTEMSFAVGLMLGPVVCGCLADAFGFYYTACTLAGVTAAAALSSLIFFTHKSPVREADVDAAE